MSAEFADANAVFYLMADDLKADRAEDIQEQGSWTSVLVLNEAVVKCRKNAGFSWENTASFMLARHDRDVFGKAKPLNALELQSTLASSIWLDALSVRQFPRVAQIGLR